MLTPIIFEMCNFRELLIQVRELAVLEINGRIIIKQAGERPGLEISGRIIRNAGNDMDSKC